jgi:hypothetical protein
VASEIYRDHQWRYPALTNSLHEQCMLDRAILSSAATGGMFLSEHISTELQRGRSSKDWHGHCGQKLP